MTQHPSADLDPKHPKELRWILPASQKRCWLCYLLVSLILALALGFILYGMRQSISFYKTPSEVSLEDIQTGKVLRLSGFVVPGTVHYGISSLGRRQLNFSLTDGKKQFPISYEGVVPDLFREGQQMVAEGQFVNKDNFLATRILAKHDETYRQSYNRPN